MSQQIEKKLNLNDITNISRLSETFSHADHDYIFSHMVIKDTISRQTIEPVQFDGLTLLLIANGTINITISSQNYVMGTGCLTILGPNDIITPTRNNDALVEVYALFLSKEFLNGVNFDINVINPRLFIDHDPVLQLDDEELDLLNSFFTLLHKCAGTNADVPQQLSIITRSISRNIVVAMMYQLAFINEKHHLLKNVHGDNSVPTRSRKINYVHDFMRLLQQYYRQERTVAFYAERLCISPKYLSLLVRDVTGRTAAAIIDQYVINEAKNMLRFSGYTIQQVAYKLNFPNQSAFGKYFKHITGLSPTAFRSN